MSVRISIPDAVAHEIYWFLEEMQDDRMSEAARRWFRTRFKAQMPEVWNRLQERTGFQDWAEDWFKDA